jgi:head-tail adaptor
MAIKDYYRSIFTQRLIATKNVIGGTTNAWSNWIGTTGLINQDKSGMVFKVDQHQIESTHKLYTDVGQDITKYDRIVDENGYVYMIISEPQDTVQRGHHWLVYLKKLNITVEGFIYVSIDGFIYVTDEGA